MRVAPFARAALLCAALAGCQRLAPAGSAGGLRAHAGDFSVYELPGGWRDGEGSPRELASLRGRVQLVALVYTHCTHTCPQVIADFKQVEARLPAGERGRVGFVLVSLDPARDTPAQLRSFATTTRLEAPDWTLLTGSEEGVMELAALLGIRYRREAGGDISHANAWLVLDEAGRIAYRHEGSDDGIDEPLEAIHELARAGIHAAPAGR
jgi:protein SCO1/2